MQDRQAAQGQEMQDRQAAQETEMRDREKPEGQKILDRKPAMQSREMGDEARKGMGIAGQQEMKVKEKMDPVRAYTNRIGKTVIAGKTPQGKKAGIQ